MKRRNKKRMQSKSNEKKANRMRVQSQTDGASPVFYSTREGAE